MKKTIILASILLSSFLVACGSKVQEEKTPALFDSQVEAERAARNFNCTGAHKMGKKWMPCKSHKSHEDNHKGNKQSHNHHH